MDKQQSKWFHIGLGIFKKYTKDLKFHRKNNYFILEGLKPSNNKVSKIDMVRLTKQGWIILEDNYAHII